MSENSLICMCNCFLFIKVYAFDAALFKKIFFMHHKINKLYIYILKSLIT